MRLLTIPLLVVLPSALLAENWPAWRGPTGQGFSSEKGLPTKWSRTDNVKWKVKLPGPGNSTPIVWETKVFITQASGDTKTRALHCLDRAKGELLWKREVSFDASEATHRDNPYCSASPVTDGERVVVSHGSAGVHCYDLAGEPLWHRDLGSFDHVWGNAASPVLHGDLCFLNCGPGERTFLVALDKKTGETVWKHDVDGGYRALESGKKGSWTGSWSTPVVVGDAGSESLLMSFPHKLFAFAPLTGKVRWSCDGLGKLVYTSPITSGIDSRGVVVAMSGYMGPPMAVRMGGAGDVTSSHRLWHSKRGPQRIGSGIVHEGRVYVANDNGTAECLDLETGERVWHERLGGQIWSSLVFSEGKLYTADKRGTFFVFRASPEFELISKNEIGELTRASIAISGGELFLRTYEHLWCITHAVKK